MVLHFQGNHRNQVRFIGCGVLILLFGFVSGVSAQSSQGGREAQKWAVVIGVGNYQDQGISKLPLAVNDARAMAAMLVSMPDGFPKSNVMLLADTEGPERQPTRSNMFRYLNSWLNLAGPEDTVLVYFAGHGTTENEALYLLPSDTSLADVAQTGYAFAGLEQLLKKIPAQKKVLIMDACHSGTGRSLDTMSPDAMRELERASQGMVTLASCSGSEKSYEMADAQHGAFTYFLMEALSGKADKDGDGYVSASETSLYTWDNTRRWASEQGLRQTPWRREEVAGEIVLAKTGGALPKPAPYQQTHAQAASLPPASAQDISGKWRWRDQYDYMYQGGKWRFISCDHIILEQRGSDVIVELVGFKNPGISKAQNWDARPDVCRFENGMLRGVIKVRQTFGGADTLSDLMFDLTLDPNGRLLSGSGRTMCTKNIGFAGTQIGGGPIMWERIE